MADAVPALREFPLDIQIRTADAAGPALQAAFMINRYSVAFQPVNISRAKIQTGLLFALLLANIVVFDFQMTFLIYLKTIQK